MLFPLEAELDLACVSMPRKGYKSITVPEDLYERLMEKAQEESLTLPDLIARLFGEAFSQEKGSSGVQIPPRRHQF